MRTWLRQLLCAHRDTFEKIETSVGNGGVVRREVIERYCDRCGKDLL